MSTIKISQLPTFPAINANTFLTTFVGVDNPTDTTFQMSANTLALGLFRNSYLNVGANPITFPNTIGQFSGSSQSYLQVNQQNFNANGSSDYILTCDVGTDSAGFIDIGINNSQWNSSAQQQTSQYPLDGYLIVQGDGIAVGNLVIGTATQNANVVFAVGGYLANNVVLKLTNTGLVLNTQSQIVFGDGTAQSTAANNYQANLALGNALAASNYANGAFRQANSGYASGNTTASYANAAFLQSNAAFIQANTVYSQSNSSYTQSNAAFIQANAVYSLANTHTTQIAAVFNQANTALANTSNTIFGGNLIITGTVSSPLINIANSTVYTDGTAIYGHPSNTQIGLIPTEQFFVLGNTRTYTTGNGNQNTLLGVGVSVSGNTRHFFELKSQINKTDTGAEALSLGFAGTATINRVTYYYTSNSSSGTLIGSIATTSPVSGNVITLASGAAVPFTIEVSGVIDVSTAGTIIPTIGATANIGTVSVVAGSMMSIYPVGNITGNTAVGVWA